MGNPKQDKKRILADPVTAHRNRYPQAAAEQLEHLQQLHHDYLALQGQQREIQDRTHRLSRKIGAAKQAGEATDDLLASMQAQSIELKTVTAGLARTRASIMEHFDADESTTLTPSSDTGPTADRYPASAAAEQDPDIIQLDDNVDAWNAYVASHPAASVYHRAEWRQLIQQTFGHDCRYFLARDRARHIVGVLPLVHLRSRMFGNFMISMPYFNYGGAIADSPLIEQRLMETANDHAAQAGISHIEYRDTLPREGLPVRRKKVCMLLPLPDRHETLWQRFPSKLRAQIKRPQQAHPEVLRGGLERLDDFYAVFARNMRDLGTPVYGKSFFRNILKTFPRESTIVSLRLNGKPVAAAFLIGHGDQLEIPWASTLREVNHLSMNMLMYWEVLKFAIEQNYRQFDFGRSSRDSGTFRFKQQWGAQPRQLYWHYWLKDTDELPELNPDSPKYALAINLWKHLPLALANRIGPPLVKYLP